MDKDQLVALWLQVFPNSHAFARNILGQDAYFNGYLFKDKTEWPHGYPDNDPLYYRASYDPELNEFKESGCTFYVRPEQGSYLAMGSDKLRLKTIKNVNAAKLIARFEQVKALIEANANNAFKPELVNAKLKVEA